MRPSTLLRKCLLLIAVVATAGGGLTAGSGQAAAAKLQSPFATMVITAFSETGDLIGEGSQAEFDPSSAVMTGSVAADQLDITASGGTLGNTFVFDIAPAHGATFAAGEYLNVQQTPSRQAGHPGLDITSINEICSTDTGSFEVREVAYAGKAVSSLDLLYEQHCNGAPAALFGEIRFGESLTGRVFVASQSITFPDVTPDTALTEVLVPVRNLSTTAVPVGSVTIIGSDPTSFVDGNDQCSGQVLTPLTGWCYVSVGFNPSGAGPQTAVLSLPLGSRTEYVQLDGTTSSDHFSLAMTSQPGDYVGQGQKYLYTPANATMSLWGGPTGLAIDVNAGVGNLWTADLSPESGGVLKPGMFANATRWPFNGSGNGLSVYGQSRGCNTLTGSFTVQRAVFSPVDDAPEQFAATFIQHCEGATPALKGTFTYGSGATPPPASHLTATTSANSARIAWRNPASGSAYTVVRAQPAGALHPAPFSGAAVYSGAGNTATISGLVKGSRYLITAFTVDASGDVSVTTTLIFTVA